MSETRANIKEWFDHDSGEMAPSPNGDPRCPECNGDLQKCGIDLYRCRKCSEGWTIEPID